MKTPKHFYKQTAIELGLDAKLVEEVNKMFWVEVRKNISKCEVSSIYVPKIGTFYGSHFKTNEKILSMIEIIKKIEKNDPENVNKIQSCRKQLGQLLKMRNNLALQKLNKTAAKWA